MSYYVAKKLISQNTSLKLWPVEAWKSVWISVASRRWLHVDGGRNGEVSVFNFGSFSRSVDVLFW